MPENLHIRIKALRESKNFSRLYIAERRGISERSYARIESNAVEIKVSRLLQIAEILDVSPAILLCGPSHIVEMESIKEEFRKEFLSRIDQQRRDQEKILSLLQSDIKKKDSQTQKNILQILPTSGR